MPVDLSLLNAIAVGAVSGVASMLAYGRCSPQQRLQALAGEGAAIRRAMAAYDGDLQGALALSRRNLAVSCQRLRCALLPALVASAPVIGAIAIAGEPLWAFLTATSLAALAAKLILRI